LPTHPEEVEVAVTGGHLALNAITSTEGVCEDDPSTRKEKEQEPSEEYRQKRNRQKRNRWKRKKKLEKKKKKLRRTQR
jgi:hypothetical protein